MITRAGLTVFERSRIGLDPPAGSYSPAGRITHASFHHGGEEGPPRRDFASAARTLRAWQEFHMGPQRRWIDLAYNLGLDGKGRFYMGRPIGALPAAVGGHNSHSVSIVAIQDGSRFRLTPEARAALRVLCEFGIPELGLPPIGRLIRDPRPGYGLFGHKEYSGHAGNICPGPRVFRDLVTIRSKFA